MTLKRGLFVCATLQRDVAAALAAEGLSDVEILAFPCECGQQAGNVKALDRIWLTRADEFSQLLVLGEPCVPAAQLQAMASGHANVRFMASGFELFLPKLLVQDYQRDGAYLLTPGWLANWPERMQRWGFDQATAAAFFAESCERLVLLDTGTDDCSSAQLTAFAAFVNRPGETVPVGLEMLRLRLAQHWRDWTQTPDAPAVAPAGTQSAADYAMVFDLLSRLVGFAAETDLARGFFELFEMICAPSGLAYLPFQGGKAGEMIVSPGATITSAEWVEQLSGLRTDCAWLAERDGFVIRLQREGEMLGALLVDRVALPLRKADYLNLTQTILPVLALAIANVRNLERLTHSEAVLRDSEARYRALFEGAAEGILVADVETRKFSYANPAICTLLGYTVKELTGMDVQRIHPAESLPAVFAAFEAQARGELRQAPELPCLRKDGKIIYVDINTAPTEIGGRPSLVGFFTDVSDRRLNEAQLRVQVAAMEATTEAILIADCIGIVTWVNPAFTLMTGYAPADIVGHPASILVPEGQPDAAYQDIQNTLSVGKVWTGELLNRRKDGSLYPEEISITPVCAAGGVVTHQIAVKRDITERRRMEEQRQALAERLRKEQKLAAVGTLACGMGHEINNPIMGIMNYAQLIKDGLQGKDDVLEEFADEIGVEAERIAGIVRKLSAFASRDTAARVSVPVTDLVESALAPLRDALTHDRIALEVDVPDNLSAVACDRGQIAQVLTSLLSNARDTLNEKYPEGDDDKIVHVSAKEVSGVACQVSDDGTASRSGKERPVSSEALVADTLSATPDTRHPTRYLRITVEDRGIGIPDAVRARIFEPFYTTKDRSVGAGSIGKGLGLFVSHAYVQEHGGELAVETEVGQWTRFHLDLPVGATRDAELGARKSEGKA